MIWSVVWRIERKRRQLRDQRHLRIGEVAERTSVTERTLRFYEEKGLLRPPTRMDGGFRLYSDDDVQRVERIKDLQKLLGFSLAEIKEMVDAEEVKMQLAAGYNPDADLTRETDERPARYRGDRAPARDFSSRRSTPWTR